MSKEESFETMIATALAVASEPADATPQDEPENDESNEEVNDAEAAPSASEEETVVVAVIEEKPAAKLARLRRERNELINAEEPDLIQLRALNGEIAELEEPLERRMLRPKGPSGPKWDSRGAESRAHFAKADEPDHPWAQPGFAGVRALLAECGKFVRFDQAAVEATTAMTALISEGPDAVLSKIRRNDQGVRRALAKFANEAMLRIASQYGENEADVELLEVPDEEPGPAKKKAKAKKAATH